MKETFKELHNELNLKKIFEQEAIWGGKMRDKSKKIRKYESKKESNLKGKLRGFY